MFAIIGVIVLLGMVFGGFAISGGSIAVILKALPIEMMIIGGAAIGSLLIGNGLPTLKAVSHGVGQVVKGPRFARADHLAALVLTAKLMRLFKTDGAVAVEPHIENPKSSALFAEAPKLRDDPHAAPILCDTMRLLVVSTGGVSAQAIDEVLETAIATAHHDEMKAVQSLQTLSDALPALGIVAAVLGVVKTMGSIDQPPAVLGGMIGAALVGTFLGVLLSYGLVGPIAGRLKQIVDADGEVLHAIRRVIVASLKGLPQPLVLEAGRAAVSRENQPSFTEAYEAMRAR